LKINVSLPAENVKEAK